MIEQNSSAFWEGDCNRETLQRIYGISFPDSKQLKEWQHIQEEAAKRNHRKIGLVCLIFKFCCLFFKILYILKEQELFFFHELSPGSCFFYPKGAAIYNKLIEFMKVRESQLSFVLVTFCTKFQSEYRKRGFHEVITPNVYNAKLWMTSGHWQHYSVYYI